MLVAGGSTDVTTEFALRLTADGTAATGLTITGFDLQYVRNRTAPVAKVDATALVATDSAHADNKAIEIDSTDQPGLYRVDWPDAAFAAGVRSVILTVKVATAFTEHLRVEIDAEVTAEALGTQAKADVESEVTDALVALGLDPLINTTIATVNSQIDFDLTADSGDDNTYVDGIAIFTDASTPAQKSFRRVLTHTTASKNITIDAAPDFTIAGTDKIRIFAAGVTATAAAIADAVHDEPLADHQTQGTAGAALTMTAYLGPIGPGVYIDDGAANTGTTLGDDGTVENPVSTIAAATTIASSLGVQTFYLINDTQITLAQAYEGYTFVGLGLNNKVTFGSQDVDNAGFQNLMLTGTQGGTGQIYAIGCSLTALVALEIIAWQCWLIGNNTLRAATTHIFKDCCSAVAGQATPDLTFPGSGTTEVSFRHYSGGLTVKSATANDTMSFEADGQIIIDASCTSLTISVRGNCQITDNGTTTSITQEAAINLTNINNEVDTAIETYGLDHLISAAVSDTDVADNSIIAEMVDAGSTSDYTNYSKTEDSLRAISEKVGAIGTVTGSGFPYAVDGDNTLRDTIDNAAAVDKGGGLVGIPVTGHSFVAGKEITIAGSTSYNNAYEIVSQTTDEVVITETYAAEDFGGSETIVSSIEGVVFVGTQTLTFTATEADDGTTHDILHDNNVIDIVYTISIDGGQRATDIELKGFVNSANDNILIQAFDFASSDWETRGTLVGQGGSSNKTVPVKALAKHTGTGANLGQIYVRLITEAGSSSPTLKTDELFVDASGIGQSVGYALGRIWANTLSGTAGTVPFTHGVGDNPSLLWADVLTLSASVGLTDFHIINGSTIQLTGNSDNFSLFGDNWALDLNGQSVDGARFEGANVSGTFTGTPRFSHCEINAITGPSAHLDDCALNDTITVNAAGDWVLHDPKSDIAGPTTPIFDFGTDVGVSSNVIFADHQNGIEFRNYNNSGTDLLSLSGVGQVIYAASCSGSVEQRGDWRVTNTGGVTIVEDDNTANIAATLIDTTEIGTAGAGLTNINLPNQTMDIIGDITGNLSGSVGSLAAQAKADVQTEVDTSLASYDGPTNAEMEARTLVAASYFDPATDAVASVTLVDTVTTNTDMVGTDNALLAASAPTNFGDMAITVTTGLVDITQAAADKTWSTVTRALTDKAGFSLSTAGILAVWHQTLTTIVTVGSIGKLIKDEITAVRMATLTDWINGGRLDNILDARMAETSISTTAGVVNTVTTVTNGVGLSAAAVDDIWDEVLSMAAHNNAQSAGKRLRQISTSITTDGTVNDASASTTAFDTDLTDANDFWVDALIIFTSGALAGQSRPILTYVNASGRITIDEALTSAPANGVEFVIKSTHIHPIAQITAGVLAGSLSSETTAGTLSKAISDIETDTTEIGTAGAGLTNINLPNQTMNITGNLSGSVGSVTGAVGSVAGNVDGNVTGSVGSLAAQAKTDVNAEVVDALNVDTYAEPGQGTPAATASIVAKLGYVYKQWRNKSDNDGTTIQLYNGDTTTVDQKRGVAEAGGTVTKNEIITGP